MFIDPYNFQFVKILDKKFIADDTVAISTEKPIGYTFQPGQYAVIKAMMDTNSSRSRQYSFASSSDQSNLEFLIRRQPNGEVSNWFYDIASTGDEISLSKPLGNFTNNDTEPSLLIAGGSGLAPFLSMVRSSPSNLSLLYSERVEIKVCYRQQLADLLDDRFCLIISGASGRINKSALTAVTNYKQILICGSKLFVDDICQLLIQLNVPESTIKRELFTLQ